jgi:eukaryotic-like serine/threonine-protein kinase
MLPPYLGYGIRSFGRPKEDGVQEYSSWGFAEGDEIVPGRHATRLLGGGRRYEAYLAWDDALHALVVVKIVRPALLQSGSARLALAGEAHALRSLNHPTIVRMFDAVVDGERPHLVLEHLDGPRLSTLTRRYRVIVEQLLPLALELCSALHYMHGRGFVHLDVKPRNVVMSDRPRLIDLSVAATTDTVSSFTRPVGTDAYMAPEQCDPERFSEIGPPSDVWGLGVTLYEAVSRSLPFPPAARPTATGAARYPQLVADPVPLGKEAPLELGEAILACLERKPADRPSALDLAQTIEPWVASLPAPRLGLFRPGGRTRRHESSLSRPSPASHGESLVLTGMRGGTRDGGGMP